MDDSSRPERVSPQAPPSISTAGRILEIDQELADSREPLGKTLLFFQLVIVVSLVLVGWKHLTLDQDFLLIPMAFLGVGGLYGAKIAIQLLDSNRRRKRLHEELDELLGGATKAHHDDHPHRPLP